MLIYTMYILLHYDEWISKYDPRYNSLDIRDVFEISTVAGFQKLCNVVSNVQIKYYYCKIWNQSHWCLLNCRNARSQFVRACESLIVGINSSRWYSLIVHDCLLLVLAFGEIIIAIAKHVERLVPLRSVLRMSKCECSAEILREIIVSRNIYTLEYANYFFNNNEYF